MLSQGWIPGSLLGATNINQNTEASSSHIRITRREDKYCLGRPRQGAQGDTHCTGLDVFQGILGRLNGRDEVETGVAKSASEDWKTVNYLESRWQVLKFVSSGFLVGDQPENAIKQHDQMPSLPISQSITNNDSSVNPGFQAEVIKDNNHTRSLNVSKLCKPKRTKTKRSFEDRLGPDAKIPLASTKSQSPDPPGSQEPHEEAVPDFAQSAVLERPKRGREAELKQRKRRKKNRGLMENMQNQGQSKLLVAENDLVKSPESRSTPVLAGLSNRHAVRQRYIRQKRMATRDTKALNEVYQSLSFGCG